MNRKRVAIIDPIGSKAGLDSYNSDLLSALSEWNIDGFLYSNFHWADQPDHSFPFFSETIGHKFSGLILKPLRYLRVLRHAKDQKVTSVIIHVFHFNKMDEWIISKIRERGFKIIVIVHDIESFIQKTDLSRLKKICKLADELIVHSKYIFDELRKFVAADTMEKVHIIPHGNFLKLANNKLSKAEARHRLNMDKDEKIVLFFGMIKPNKGLDILLHSWKNVQKPSRLIIAGRLRNLAFDPFQKIINEELSGNDLSLMIRQIGNEERDLLFRAADLIVLPYSRIYQSGVLLMAMSYGLPVIATDLKGFEEVIVNNENGLLVKVNDQEAITKAINKLIEDSELRKRLSFNAKKVVENNHNWIKIASQLKELLA